MKSIGIITYHHYYNYGTMLQALALQKKIEECGYQSEIIDYKTKRLTSVKNTFFLRLKRVPIYILEFQKYNTLRKSRADLDEKNRAFERFYNQYLKVSNTAYDSVDELNSECPVYDGYIVGSDQTWNPFVSGRPEAFYLPFVKNDAKKGSYAPSLAVSSLTEEQSRFIKERLSCFKWLSVREKTGAQLLESVLGKNVTQVLDPTLLLDKEQWMQYGSHKFDEEKYIFVYLLGEKKEHRKIIDNLQKKLGLKVICMPVSYLELANKNYKHVYGGPDDFISLIANAELVCTDSFHGTMFSINFEKQFYSFCKTDDNVVSSENSRLKDALEMFGVEDRLITDTPSKIVEINYKEIIKKVNREKEKSLSYLQEMLIDITR